MPDGRAVARDSHTQATCRRCESLVFLVVLVSCRALRSRARDEVYHF